MAMIGTDRAPWTYAFRSLIDAGTPFCINSDWAVTTLNPFEIIGTAVLVTVVVGSGIAAERLSPDDVGLQLLENSTATVFGLAVPQHVEGVPVGILDPRATWADPAAYDAQAAKLSAMFRKNFEKFGSVDPTIVAAGPRG